MRNSSSLTIQRVLQLIQYAERYERWRERERNESRSRDESFLTYSIEVPSRFELLYTVLQTVA